MEEWMNDNIKIRNIFREIFDDDEMDISDDFSRGDIEDWDSVAHVKLVLALEEEFGIRLTIDV
jgi:acyl carrier protein